MFSSLAYLAYLPGLFATHLHVYIQVRAVAVVILRGWQCQPHPSGSVRMRAGCAYSLQPTHYTLFTTRSSGIPVRFLEFARLFPL